MKRLLNAKIAMAFSDPAGANACLAIAKIKNMNGQPVPPMYTNRKPHLSKDFNFPLILSSELPNFKNSEIEYLFTGTSHPDSSENFECRCIENALKENIYSISFIDHWTNFRLRFSGLQPGIFPDEIWVVDDVAKRLAIGEGLPAERLKVSGNPYHYYLKEYWRSSFNKKEYLINLGVKLSDPVFLYAPDPVSLRPGIKAIGFSELEVLADIIEILKKGKTQPLLLVKLHPLQPKTGIEDLIAAAGYDNCIILKGVNFPELLNAVDYVIGFYSNTLLEAAALGKSVIRYFPGYAEKDLLRHTEVGTFVSHKADLKKTMNRIMKFV